MLFHTQKFIVVFCLGTLLYWAVFNRGGRGGRRKYIFLFATSVLFYSTWNVFLTGLLLLSVLVNYVLGRKVAGSSGRVWLFVGVAYNLIVLGFFKYANV